MPNPYPYPMNPQRVLILWGSVTSYFLASINALNRDLDGKCEIIVVSPESSFWYPELSIENAMNNITFVTYNDFNPKSIRSFDLLLVSSWNFKKYRMSARLNRKACVVMSMDNQFKKSFRQLFLLASKVGPFYIRYLFDYVFVAGQRQAKYAQLLGFSPNQIFNGVYSYDDKIFKIRTSILKENRFLFVGRKVPAKGLETLLSAYEFYRDACTVGNIDPWKLILAGPGSTNMRLPMGATEFDYLVPEEASEMMSGSRCFVLPSQYEPFGVVLTEAAATGSLLIASSAVGAADDLIDENVNGFTFPVNSSQDFADAMLKITLFTAKENTKGEEKSINRAKQFAPNLWSKKLLATFDLHQKLESQ